MRLKTLFFIFPCLLLSFSLNAKNTYLRVHTESAPKTLDPAQATGTRELQIINSMFEGLTRYHPQTLKPLPGVAQSWGISKDQKTYTFHLRSDAKWSDGRAVTAQDFFNGWERLLNPATAAPYASQLFYIVGARDYAQGKIKDPALIGMKVKGTWVFEVTLEEPVPYFLTLTSFIALSPIRKESAGQPWLKTNGAFMLDQQDPQKGIVLIPNPFYWGRHEIKLSGIEFRPFGDFQTALNLYGRTGIDILADLPPQQVPMLRFRSDFHSVPLFRTEYFVLNCTKAPFNNIQFRKALAFAINREEITKNVLKRGDVPYGFFIPPGLIGYQNGLAEQKFDPVQAKKYLAKSGIDPGKPLPPIKILFNKATDRQLIVQSAQAMWQKYLNLQSTLSEEEWSVYIQRRLNKDFQISWGGWVGDYLDPNTFLELFTSGNRQNYSGWSNQKYDELIQKAIRSKTKEERFKLFAEAEKILLDEAVIIPVLVKSKTYLIQPYIKGYSPNLFDIHPLRDVYSLRP